MPEKPSPFIIWIRSVGLLLLLGLSSPVYSQVDTLFTQEHINSINDTVVRYMQRHPGKFAPLENRARIRPLYGLNYSPERQLEGKGGMSLTYRNGLDRTASPSTFILYGTISTNLSFGFRAAGLNNSADGRLAILYEASYTQWNKYFWGIGLENNSQKSNRSNYVEGKVNCKGEFLFSIGRRVVLGPSIGFEYFNTRDYTNPDLIAGQPTSARDFNIGLRFRFDSRDNILIPEKGVFLSLNQNFYPGFIFHHQPFYKTVLTADFFTRAWKGAVLAFDLFGEFNYGESPWLFWGNIGGANRMRGYYEGRYKERNMVSAQMEIRQRIYRMHGIAIWGGAGNLFHSFREFDIKETLPTYGAGYRLTIAGLVFRVDAGFGNRGQYAILAGVNHSF